MVDSVVMGVAGSIQKPTYTAEPHMQTANAQAVVGEPKVKQPSSSKESNLGNGNKDDRPKPAPKERKELVIDILPLNQPMGDKISDAIDTMVYGKPIGPKEEYKAPDKSLPPELRAYEPKVSSGKSLDIEG